MDTLSLVRLRALQFLFVVCSIVMIYTLVPAPSNKAYVNINTKYYYPLLTKSFLSGQLSLPIKPSAGILKLANPYDPEQNKYYRVMFDASLYKGKYYIYFGPLPMVFFIPYAMVTGQLASSHAAVLFFMALGFIVSFYLLSKIKMKYFPELSTAQWLLAGLVLGVSNNAMYLIGRPCVYEVADASNFCFMNLALLFLYNIFNSHYKNKDIFLFSLCLSLCVAGRPHFFLVCLTLLPIIFILSIKHTLRTNLIKSTMALLLPFVAVMSILALYNYVRFDSIFEFGMNYEIADNNRMWETTFDVTLMNWMRGIYYYFFSTLGTTDWIYISPHSLKTLKFTRVFMVSSYPTYFIGYVKSIFTTSPIVLFLFALPFVFKKKDQQWRPLLKFVGLALLASSIIILYMISINTVVQRYVTDFLGYLVLLAIIAGWMLDKTLTAPLSKKVFMGLFVMAELLSLGLAFTI